MTTAYSVQPLQLAMHSFSFLDILAECRHPIYVELADGRKASITHRLAVQNYLIWYFMMHPQETLNFYIHEEDKIRFNDYSKEA